MLRAIKRLIITLFQFIGFLLKVVLFTVLLPFRIIGYIFKQLTRLIRFSISFKINFVFISMLLTFMLIINLLWIDLINRLGGLKEHVVVFENAIPAIVITNILGMIIVIYLSIKTSNSVISPIKEMTTEVKEISVNNLSKRVDTELAKDELKDLADTFNRMMDEIESSYDKQNQFVSDASHELRTPIAVIQGYANLLDRWGKDDEKVLLESIEAIKSESESMKLLIERLLFLARSDKGNLEMQKETFRIDDLISEIAKETEMLTNDRIIISRIEYSGNIYGNRKFIKQGLRIFIENAIKYSEANGTIEIALKETAKSIRVIIADDGIGISKEDLPKIFDRFYRADKSRTKERGGTGLGLSIAKWIFSNHNAALNAESTLGQGTKIIIDFLQ